MSSAARRASPTRRSRLLREAVAIEDGIPYNEPPVWHHPPRQVLGAVLLEAGRPAEAEAVYREDLEALPRERVVAVRSGAEPRGAAEVERGARGEAAIRDGVEAGGHPADIVASDGGGHRPGRTNECVRRVSSSAPSLHAAASTSTWRTARAWRTSNRATPMECPVILLHGYTDSWRSYERVLPHLPQSLRVLAVTQRGHGDSGKPDGEYESRVFARDVANFMDTLGIERAVIVGHSMGSTVAQRFAVDYPQRVRALVLAGAFFPRPANTEVRKFSEEVSTLRTRSIRRSCVTFRRARSRSPSRRSSSTRW